MFQAILRRWKRDLDHLGGGHLSSGLELSDDGFIYALALELHQGRARLCHISGTHSCLPLGSSWVFPSIKLSVVPSRIFLNYATMPYILAHPDAFCHSLQPLTPFENVPPSAHQA